MNNELTEVRVLLSNRSNQSDDLLSAATLAKILKATLQGVFLEEEDLICAAELSISSEISRWSAKEKEISSDSIQQTLRTHALHQKRQLKRIAEQEKIEYRFDVVRGERYAWILDEIKNHKVLFVSQQNIPRSKINHLNYSFLRQNTAVKNPVTIVFTGSDASVKALEIAIQIALLEHRPITILLNADTFENEIILREQLNSYLSKHKNLKVNAELIKPHDQAKSLTQEFYMLVYPLENDDVKLLSQLLHNLQNPLILVR